MNLVEVAEGRAPKCGGGLVTSERAGGRDVQRRGRHLVYADL
jgi:hypothetical protein